MKNSACIVAVLLILICNSCNPISSKIKNAREGLLGSEAALKPRLEEALALAEGKYGKRDASWTLAGIAFSNENHPRISFPGLGKGKREILVQLPIESANNERKALFELSHEVIHLLSPLVGPDTASVFEEGLAVHFSLDYLKVRGFSVRRPKTFFRDKRYEKALDLVQPLYEVFPDADERIREARRQAGGITAIKAEEFEAFFPGFAPDFYQRLEGNFSKSL